MDSPTPTVAATLAAGAWDVNPAVGLLVLAFAVGGLLAMAWLWRSTAPTRISPGPATMELRDERPALVDLLTGGFQVEDDAVPATLVDLAARRHVEIDELGGKVTIRPRRHGSHTDDELTAYEQRVLTHLDQHAVGGVVPAEVITLGPEGVSERWFKSFVREVNRHGQSLGLCRRRFDAKHLVFAWGIVIVAFAPAWIVANVTPRTPDPRGLGIDRQLVDRARLPRRLRAGLGGTADQPQQRPARHRRWAHGGGPLAGRARPLPQRRRLRGSSARAASGLPRYGSQWIG